MKPKRNLLLVLFIISEIVIRNRIKCEEETKSKLIRNPFRNQVPIMGDKNVGVDCDNFSEDDLVSDGSLKRFERNRLGETKRGEIIFREENSSGSEGDEDEEEDEGDDEENREQGRIQVKRYEELQILNTLQRIKNNKITEAPRGVQDQFIEMLGSSKSIRIIDSNKFSLSKWRKKMRF